MSLGQRYSRAGPSPLQEDTEGQGEAQRQLQGTQWSTTQCTAKRHTFITSSPFKTISLMRRLRGWRFGLFLSKILIFKALVPRPYMTPPHNYCHIFS